jgi:hypothetical protein
MTTKAMLNDWTTYRTRFLIRARQLDHPLTFVDCLGREHSGGPGDYLVLSSDGSRRIAPREIFEDIYVPLNRPEDPLPLAGELAGLLPADLIATIGEKDQLVCRALKPTTSQCLPASSMRGQKGARQRSAERSAAS